MRSFHNEQKSSGVMVIKLGEIEYDNLFFCFVYTITYIISLMERLFGAVAADYSAIGRYITYVLIVVMFLKVLPKLLKIIRMIDLCILGFVGISILLGAVSFYSDTKVVFDALGSIYFRGLLLYYAVKLFHLSEKTNWYLRISFLIIFLTTLFNTSNIQNLTGGYSQYDGYSLLYALALLYVPLFKEHKIYDIALTIITVVVALLTGARGPFLLCVLMIIVGFMLSGFNRRGHIVIYILAGAAAITIFMNYQTILYWIALHSGGTFSMRTISRILNGSVLQDSGRNLIYGYAISFIKEHPIVGCGILNDRVLLSRNLSGLGGSIGSYPHNFFLEIFMQFGLPVGLLILFFLLKTVLKKYSQCTVYEEKLLFWGFVFCGFMPLMFSGSYLTFYMFWLFLGFVVNNSHKSGEYQ